MSFVVDASVTACWLLPDEAHPVADAARLKLADEEARAPAIWWYEIRNVILIAQRRGRLAPDKAASAFETVDTLPIRCISTADALAVRSFALRHGLTFYDAAYLALAIAERLPLATLDRELRAAAVSEGVALVVAA